MYVVYHKIFFLEIWLKSLYRQKINSHLGPILKVVNVICMLCVITHFVLEIWLKSLCRQNKNHIYTKQIDVIDNIDIEYFVHTMSESLRALVI